MINEITINIHIYIHTYAQACEIVTVGGICFKQKSDYIKIQKLVRGAIGTPL
jgi:hypothetical protein